MKTSRRQFLRSSGAAVMGAAAMCRPKQAFADRAEGQVMTVRGPIAPEELGTALAHEHVLVDFVGADRIEPGRYDPDEVFRVVLPHLKQAHSLGARALFECTPAYLGRDPGLLRRLSEAADLHLITNTGYYGAANDKFVPAHAYEESAEDLARRWTREWRSGIGDSGVRPGFIKIGVDKAPLSDIDEKLVRAAARTHLATGLTIAAHTPDGRTALEELRILEQEGVAPEAFIWVHAQNEKDTTIHLEAASQGAWVEFDGIRPESVERHIELVKAMVDAGHANRVLLSHDAGWYTPGEPNGGDFRPYDTLFTAFLPALQNAGVSGAIRRQITVENPAKAFQVGMRARK